MSIFNFHDLFSKKREAEMQRKAEESRKKDDDGLDDEIDQTANRIGQLLNEIKNKHG